MLKNWKSYACGIAPRTAGATHIGPLRCAFALCLGQMAPEDGRCSPVKPVLHALVRLQRLFELLMCSLCLLSAEGCWAEPCFGAVTHACCHSPELLFYTDACRSLLPATFFFFPMFDFSAGLSRTQWDFAVWPFFNLWTKSGVTYWEDSFQVPSYLVPNQVRQTANAKLHKKHFYISHYSAFKDTSEVSTHLKWDQLVFR